MIGRLDSPDAPAQQGPAPAGFVGWQRSGGRFELDAPLISGLSKSLRGNVGTLAFLQ